LKKGFDFENTGSLLKGGVNKITSMMNTGKADRKVMYYCIIGLVVGFILFYKILGYVRGWIMYKNLFLLKIKILLIKYLKY